MNGIVKVQALAMSTQRKLRNADKKLVAGLRAALAEGWCLSDMVLCNSFITFNCVSLVFLARPPQLEDFANPEHRGGVFGQDREGPFSETSQYRKMPKMILS